MNASQCISCKTLRGEIQPPGGFIHENADWILFLRSRPPLIAGQGFIVLKQHCENLAELTVSEQKSLGVIMAQTTQAMMKAFHVEKVHFGLYGEGVKHIHLHVTPRTAELPAGNIPLVWLGVWRGLLERLRLRQAISDELVASTAENLKAAFQQLS